jgi:hypothetical protein
MMGKALTLECGGWFRADYDKLGQERGNDPEEAESAYETVDERCSAPWRMGTRAVSRPR